MTDCLTPLMFALPSRSKLMIYGLPSDRPLARRLGDAHQAVWRKLPRCHRAALVEHWDHPPYPLRWSFPGGEVVQLSDGSVPVLDILGTDLADRTTGVRLWASCSCEGYQLRYARDVAAMPDAVLEALAAHELMHVYQYALPVDCDFVPGSAKDGWLAEIDADERMRELGWDPELLVDFNRRMAAVGDAV